MLMADCDYNPGALGCAFSHVNLWKKAARDTRIMTIFEDDAIATYRFQEKAAQLIGSLSDDWDLIQWGYNFNPLFIWVNFGFSKANVRFYSQHFQHEDILNFQSLDFRSVAVGLAHSYGTFAYSISPKGARSLLQHLIPLSSRLIPFPGAGVVASNTGLDCAMSGAYGSMQAFICIPPLVLEDKAQESEIGDLASR
jgi:GR25 family glycosyltransferase involved in LPS biosynthesis